MSASLRYVTVVTYGRTGSTAVQAALNALPGVLVRGENYEALRGLHRYVQSIAETADRHHAGRPDHPWFGSARLDPPAVVADLREHVVRTVLRPRRDTAWIGFKEVRYTPGHFRTYDDLLDYLLFLGKLFPRLAYVVNVRDEAAAARSGWWPDDDAALTTLATARRWLTSAVADLERMVGVDRAVLLDYDAWSADPAPVCAAFARIGLPRADAAVRQALSVRLAHGPHDSHGPQGSSTETGSPTGSPRTAP